MITPLAPRDPKIAVAEAAFYISMEAMCEGLILANGLISEVFPKVEVATSPVFTSICTPSITYKGCVPELKEFAPRMLIFTAAPGSPDEEVICTPATLPCNPSMKEMALDCCSSEDFTVATAPVRSDFLCAP